MKFRILLVLLTFQALPAQSFDGDVCRNSPLSGLALLRNCIGVEESCRAGSLRPEQQVACRQEAFTDSISGLIGANDIIGGGGGGGAV